MIRNFLSLLAITLLSLTAVPLAFAEGEETTASGKVTARSSSSISLATDDKANPVKTFVINDKTQVQRARAAISIEAVEVGELAGVIAKNEGGQLIATVIQTRAKR